MSVASLSETRVFDRTLEFTRDAILPQIWDTAFDHSPLLAMMFGRLSNARFGAVQLNGRGKQVQTGGESIVARHNLGANTTATELSGPWDTVMTDPSDTVRHSRINWRHYSATVTLSDTDLLINRGPEALSSMVEFETRNAVVSLADRAGDHLYSAGGLSTRLTDLAALISANDSVQGLSGATYTTWNSRGVSARGTAPGSISFASAGAWPTNALADMRNCWNNASEGAIHPMIILLTYTDFANFESANTSNERFMNTTAADAGFTQLAFHSAPVFPDSKQTSGQMFQLNFDFVRAVMLAGADFTAGPFERAEQQEARVSKIMAKMNTVMLDRRFSNKVTGIT